MLPAPIPLSRREHSVWNGGPGVRPPLSAGTVAESKAGLKATL